MANCVSQAVFEKPEYLSCDVVVLVCLPGHSITSQKEFSLLLHPFEANVGNCFDGLSLCDAPAK